MTAIGATNFYHVLVFTIVYSSRTAFLAAAELELAIEQ